MRIFPTLLFLMFAAMLSAQQDSTIRLHVIARNTTDSVILRWAPSGHIQWSRLNRYGYRVERLVIREDQKGKSTVELLTKDTLRPWKLEQWKSGFPADHPYAPIAVQALYGTSFQPTQYQSDVASIKAKSQESELRHGFSLLMADLNGPTANALALRYVDKTAAKDVRILYRIISLDPEYRDTALVGIDRKAAVEPVPKPEKPEVEEGDKVIRLRWKVYPERPVFTGYWLERSEDGRNWKKLTSSPMIKSDGPNAKYPEPYLYFTDTLISANYKPYQYRLSGITPFGENSAPSAIITAMGRDRNAPPSPEMKDPKDIGGKLKISWSYDAAPPDLIGFLIAKSPAIGGPFDVVTKDPLPPTAREWIDDNPDGLGENYYVVYAKDTAGNLAASMPAYGFLKDTIPPGKPVKPMGSIDTAGVVNLHWKAGPEADIMGYRVFFANKTDHEFSLLTPEPIQDTIFTDTITLNTLTGFIYYQIVAVDRNFNHSPVSDILALKKPDILPPVEPLFSKFLVKDAEVELEMIASTSKDVKEHVLQRKKAEESNWNVIAQWQRNQMPKRYSDKSVEGETFYEYRLQAIDSSGNKSPFSPLVSIRTKPKVSKNDITGMKSSWDDTRKVVVLEWAAPAPEVKYYIVYRGKNDKRPATYASPDGKSVSFEDNMVNPRSKYTYMIRAIYKDNGESPFAGFPVVLTK